MATHRISLLGQVLPDTSGNVYEEPYPLGATNDFWKFPIFKFNDTSTKDGLHGQREIPNNYVGTPKVYPIWTAQTITGNVVWEFAYRVVGGDDAESLDQATAQETLTVTDAAPTATDRRLTTAGMTPTAANLGAGKTLEWRLSRDGTSASDTMAGAASLVDLILEYADQ